MFTFSVFDWNDPFLTSLVEKFKTVNLSWNLVRSLNRICKIQWWCSFYLFYLEIPFLDKLAPKNKNCQFRLKFGTSANLNLQNSMVVFIFSVFDGKHPFWANVVQKIKIVSLRWNLVPRLIWICRIQWCSSRFLF